MEGSTTPTQQPWSCGEDAAAALECVPDVLPACGPQQRATLLAALTTCLASPGPMLLCWGQPARVFFNAASLELVGPQHPQLWGAPLEQASAGIRQAIAMAETGQAGWKRQALNIDGHTHGMLVVPPHAAVAGAARELMLASAFEQSPAFLAVLRGPDYVFETANLRFQEMAGDRPLIGLPLVQAMPEIVEQGFIGLLDNVRSSGQPFVGESMSATLTHPGREPYEAVLDFVYQPMHASDGSVDAILLHGVDVTQQHRAEARDSFLLALEDELHELSDPQQIIDTSVRLLGEQLHAHRCGYGAIDHDGEMMHVISDHVQGMESVQGEFRLAEVAPHLHEALVQNRPWIVNDNQAEGAATYTSEAYLRTGIRATLAVPLHKGGQLVAAMGVHQRTPRRWTSTEVELVRLVLVRCWESLQRARAQRRLAASESHLRLLADTLPQIIFVTAEDGTPQYFNQRWYEYTGIDPDADGVQTWRNAHTEVGLLHSNAAWALALAGTRAYEMECELRAGDGSFRWHLVRALPVQDNHGAVRQWIGTYTDIHDRRDFEGKLAESETRFRHLCETVPTMIWMSDAEGACVYWNPQWHDFTGQTDAEALGHDWWSALHPDDVSRVRQGFEQALQERRPFSADYRVRRADGRYRWCVNNASPHFGFDGEFLGHIGSVMDITERKHIEDETASERSILNLITTGVTLPVVLDAIAVNVESRGETDLRCAIMLVEGNRLRHAAAPHMPLDYSQQFDGLPVSADGPPCGRAAWSRHQVICDDVADDEAWGEYQATALAMGIAACCVTPIIGSNGTVLGTLSMYYRLPHVPSLHEQAMARSASYLAGIVIERNLIDAQLQQSLQSEKDARGMAEHANRVKDEFLATLSHELRTPLNAILGWSRLMQAEGFAKDNIGKGLVIIERSARSQAQIIDDLLDMSAILSGKVRLQHEHFDIAGLVRSTVELLRPAALAKQIELRSIGAEDAPIAFFGDAGRLQQVLTNLIGNAIKFTPLEGTVTVSVELEGARLRLAVRDSGIGIEPEFLPHVFDRFRQADASTTRRMGGLGLGLSISRQLVDLHHGSLGASSAGPGCGATFTVVLPVHAGAAMRPPASLAPSRVGPLPGHCRERLAKVRVLLVDDDDDSREAACELLRSAGAEVVGAGSADHAERLLQSNDFTILVSDIAMPGRDGYDLIGAVRASDLRARDIPAIALTAYVRDEDRERAMLAGFDAHIGKPLDPVGLVDLIEILSMRRRNADVEPAAAD